MKDEATDKSRSARRSSGKKTIHDIAALANVSSTTMSRYFNEPLKVSPKLKARIDEAIARTHYIRNRYAGSLASTQGKCVAVVIPSLANAAFSQTVQAITEALSASGHQLLIAHTNYSRQQEEQAILGLAGWQPGALILTGHEHTEKSMALLGQLQIPVIEMWDMQKSSPFVQVGFSHESAGRDLAMHFISQGVRRIRFISSGMAEDFRAHHRARGYAKAMKRHGLAVDIAESITADPYDAGADSIAAFSREPRAQRPQALLYAGDQIAAGAILHARSVGLELPGDCPIAAFGDFPFAQHLVPSLTTIAPAPVEIGRKTAEVLLSMLERPPSDAPIARRHSVPYRLVVRQSSRIAT